MAMSKHSAASYMERMLECPVCLDTVKEPHTLQKCFHSYCKVCVHQLIDKQNNHPPGVKCPVCRNFSSKEEIQKNFFINELALMHISSSVKKLCDQCIDGTEATWRCLDCKTNFCMPCNNFHLNIPVCKGHRVIPLAEEEDLIDKLVFCSDHPNKPIELYCEKCKKTICVICKATTHDQHLSNTVDDALKKLIPDVEEKLNGIEGNITVIGKSLTDIDEQIAETRCAFNECRNQVDKVANIRIDEIKAEQRKLKDELDQKEINEIKKLEQVKDELDSEQKEYEGVSCVVRASLDKAKHASLLNELVNEGLCAKMDSLKNRKNKNVKIQVNKHTLNPKANEWNKMKQTGLCGTLVYGIVSMVATIGSLIAGNITAGPRYWIGSLTEYFKQTFIKGIEIELPRQCTRMAVIGDHIWTAIYNDSINIYDFKRKLIRSLKVNRPTSLTQCYNGDVLITSDSGLYVVVKGEMNVQQIEGGEYSDVCSYYDSVYVLEYKKKCVVQLQCNEHNRWTRVKEINIPMYDKPYLLDTLLVKHMEGEDTDTLHVYIASRNNRTIYQFNDKGELIKQFGGRQGQGEGNLQVPYLCCMDNKAAILVADCVHNKYKILDLENEGEWSSTGITGGKYVYDCVSDEQGSFWMLNCNGTKFIITKYKKNN